MKAYFPAEPPSPLCSNTGTPDPFFHNILKPPPQSEHKQQHAEADNVQVRIPVELPTSSLSFTPDADRSARQKAVRTANRPSKSFFFFTEGNLRVFNGVKRLLKVE
jgi:hypothetical protein